MSNQSNSISLSSTTPSGIRGTTDISGTTGISGGGSTDPKDISKQGMSDATKMTDQAVASTTNIIKGFISSLFGFKKKLPTQGGEAKKKNGLGNKDYFISYTFPWILYFYPDPKADPNYVLLEPEKDKIKLKAIKRKILSFISFAIFIGLIYFFWKNGAVFPALHSMWFFFWRYITLFIFFLCFMIVIAIIRAFPFFIRRILKYMELTINPLKNPRVNKAYKKYGSFFKPLIKGAGSSWFAFLTVIWIIITVIVLIPLFGVFATLCGLLLGNLNTTYFAFGMAEYEVTETGKKSMQKRMENATGITAAKENFSSGIQKMLETETGISEKISGLTKKIPDIKSLSSVKFKPSFLK